MSKRIPRKKKKQIPNGLYCYTPTSSWKELKDGNIGYTTKECPFYEHIEGLEGRCRMLKCEITDQVKECGIKTP